MLTVPPQPPEETPARRAPPQTSPKNTSPKQTPPRSSSAHAPGPAERAHALNKNNKEIIKNKNKTNASLRAAPTHLPAAPPAPWGLWRCRGQPGAWGRACCPLPAARRGPAGRRGCSRRRWRRRRRRRWPRLPPLRRGPGAAGRRWPRRRRRGGRAARSAS